MIADMPLHRPGRFFSITNGKSVVPNNVFAARKGMHLFPLQITTSSLMGLLDVGFSFSATTQNER